MSAEEGQVILPKPMGHPPPDLDEAFRKLEPYLKAGLSLRKAAIAVDIPVSSVYEWKEKYEDFSEKVAQAKQFVSVLLSNSMMYELNEILKKQREKIPLDDSDRNFLKWFANNSRATQEEFGKRVQHQLVDPQVELRKIMGLIDDATKTS